MSQISTVAREHAGERQEGRETKNSRYSKRAQSWQWCAHLIHPELHLLIEILCSPEVKVHPPHPSIEGWVSTSKGSTTSASHAAVGKGGGKGEQ